MHASILWALTYVVMSVRENISCSCVNAFSQIIKDTVVCVYSSCSCLTWSFFIWIWIDRVMKLLILWGDFRCLILLAHWCISGTVELLACASRCPPYNWGNKVLRHESCWLIECGVHLCLQGHTFPDDQSCLHPNLHAWVTLCPSCTCILHVSPGFMPHLPPHPQKSQVLMFSTIFHMPCHPFQVELLTFPL